MRHRTEQRRIALDPVAVDPGYRFRFRVGHAAMVALDSDDIKAAPARATCREKIEKITGWPRRCDASRELRPQGSPDRDAWH